MSSLCSPRSESFADLAPTICRQRLVIEGEPGARIDDGDIRAYLRRLTDVTSMTLLLDPVTHCSDRYGWAGWVHWETSGAHFYAWDDPLFFSVDIYTCKRFDPEDAIRLTNDFFRARRLVAKEF
jgi:S-adenosylmethionine decarboxylase